MALNADTAFQLAILSCNPLFFLAGISDVNLRVARCIRINLPTWPISLFFPGVLSIYFLAWSSVALHFMLNSLSKTWSYFCIFSIAERMVVWPQVCGELNLNSSLLKKFSRRFIDSTFWSHIWSKETSSFSLYGNLTIDTISVQIRVKGLLVLSSWEGNGW